MEPSGSTKKIVEIAPTRPTTRRDKERGKKKKKKVTSSISYEKLSCKEQARKKTKYAIIEHRLSLNNHDHRTYYFKYRNDCFLKHFD